MLEQWNDGNLEEDHEKKSESPVTIRPAKKLTSSHS